MTAALPTRSAWFGLIFLAAAFGFGRLGLPGWGYAVVAVASTAVGVWVLLRHRPPDWALWLGFAAMVAMAVPGVLGLMRGQPVSVGQLAFAITVGVSVWAATLLPPPTVRWSAITVLALVSWAGLAAGALAELGVFSYGIYIEPAQDRALFGLDQLRGVMPHPNTMGIFAGLAVVLGVRQIITDYADGFRSGRRFALLAFGVVLPGAIALFWSQSRTSAIAAGFGLIVALLPLGRRGWDWVSPAIAAAAGLMITVPVIIAETVGYDFNGRGIPWGLAQDEFEANPLVGRGPEFLTQDYLAFRGLEWKPDTAHNMMMQATGESGLIGLLSLAGLIFIMALIAVRAVHVDRQWALMIFVTFCLLGGQESSLSLPVRSALVVQLAVIAASAVMLAEQTPTRAKSRRADPAPTPAG
ncbi:MAG: O-antigen ligase family protein [Actinobacteria bacterium]|nr:O-antigen ligase family protein [Actinomycetota bacterium]MCB9411327.1 O-antigen ligase family protein [Actinomycetota bacterium]